MSLPSQKLPRRHVQRRTLNHGRIRTPLLALPGLRHPQGLKAPTKEKQKFSVSDATGSSCASDSDADSSSASDSDVDSSSASDSDSSDSSPESGHSSNSSLNSEAEHYRKIRADFVDAGPTLADPCDTTKEAMRREEQIWNLYCKRTRKGDPVDALKAATAEDFKTFLVWRKENSRIKKQSSISTYWHVLSMNYQRIAQRYMDEGILLDIRNWIPQLGLDDSEGEKSALYVEDLCVLQNGHWVRDQEVFPHERLRVQMSPINIFAGCTSTRPAALVGKRPLLYEDIEFQVFPPLLKGRRPAVRLILNLKHIKRSGGKKKPKKFTFRDDEGIICCPIIFIMALAIGDNAFKNKFTSLRQIYNLVVPKGTDRIRLKWDDDWAKRPIFRDVEPKSSKICTSETSNVRISKTKSLKYPKHRYHLIRLGSTCRFRERIRWYDLRRGSGKRLNEALTPEERRQVMGNQGDVYERHYMPSFIDADCQAIYLGTTRREDLIRAVGRLERHEDAPNKLSEAQKGEISNHPYILKKMQARKRYASKLKEDGYPTIKAAKDTFWYNKHHKAQRKINRKRNQLSNELLNHSINDFHEKFHVDEVDRQMRGILPDNEVLTPSTIKYELEERAAVARLLFQSLDKLNEDQIFDVRVKLVDALAQLCHRQETPHQFKKHRQTSVRIDADDDEITQEEGGGNTFAGGDRGTQTVEEGPHVDSTLYCPFCELGPFSRKDSLGRHVRVQHLQRRAANDGFFCPYKGCPDFMGSLVHFLSHAARQHKVFL